MTAKILVVDDEPHLEIVILQVFRREIKAGELAFVFAQNGIHALSVLEKNPDVDMVLSDINMPKMSGLELLQHLNQKYPLLKTIMVTAYGDMANIRTAMNRGAFDFLNKPINFKDLKITISKTLEQVRQLKELHRERHQRFLAEKLRALTEHITTTLDMEEVVNRFRQNLNKITPCDRAVVCLKQEGKVNLIDSSIPEEHKEEVRPLIEELYTQVSRRNIPLPLRETELDTSSLELIFESEALVVAIPLNSSHGSPGLLLIERDNPVPFDKEEMNAVVALSANAAAAIENARLFEDVRRLAITDSLTSLYNRRHFLDQSQKEVIRSKRYGNPLCLLCINVDHFKTFNDTYGHTIGDLILKSVAETISNGCRQTDFLGRIGGDEIVILLIETELELAKEIAERLRTSIEEKTFSVKDQGSIPITVSIGLSTITPDIPDLNGLLNTAKKNLENAKTTGRNKVSSTPS